MQAHCASHAPPTTSVALARSLHSRVPARTCPRLRRAWTPTPAFVMPVSLTCAHTHAYTQALRSYVCVSAGTYLVGGVCYLCAKGDYCEGRDSMPHACPLDRQTTLSTGAQSAAACVCEDGYEKVAGACVTCRAGSWCKNGSVFACPDLGRPHASGASAVAECELLCQPGEFWQPVQVPPRLWSVCRPCHGILNARVRVLVWVGGSRAARGARWTCGARATTNRRGRAAAARTRRHREQARRQTAFATRATTPWQTRVHHAAKRTSAQGRAQRHRHAQRSLRWRARVLSTSSHVHGSATHSA